MCSIKFKVSPISLHILARVDIGVSTRNHISRQAVLVYVRMCYRENAPALIINGREMYEVRHVESSIGTFDTRTSAWYRSNCPVPHSTAQLFLRIQSVAKYLGAFRTQGSASQTHSRPRSRLQLLQPFVPSSGSTTHLQCPRHDRRQRST
jgi:hypothetical protein